MSLGRAIGFLIPVALVAVVVGITIGLQDGDTRELSTCTRGRYNRTSGLPNVLYVIAGQSNAQGTGLSRDPQIDVIPARAYQYVIGDAWSRFFQGALPINHTIIPYTEEPMYDSNAPGDAHIGFSATVAQNHLRDNPRDVVLILNCAGSGKTFGASDHFWRPPAGPGVVRCDAALNDIYARYPWIETRAWLWSQGESDVDATPSSEVYRAEVWNFMNYVRRNCSSTPWVSLSMNPRWYLTYTNGPQNATDYDTVMRQLPGLVSGTALVQGPGDATTPTYSNPNDFVHYNAVAQRINGLALYRAIPKAANNRVAQVTTDARFDLSNAPASLYRWFTQENHTATSWRDRKNNAVTSSTTASIVDFNGYAAAKFYGTGGYTAGVGFPNTFTLVAAVRVRCTGVCTFFGAHLGMDAGRIMQIGTQKAAVPLPYDTPIVISFTGDSTGVKMYWGGQTVGAGTALTITDVSMCIGCSFVGDIAEIALFSERLTDAVRKTTEIQMASKYGVFYGLQ